MADATGKDGVATEHIQEAELTESPEHAAADARVFASFLCAQPDSDSTSLGRVNLKCLVGLSPKPEETLMVEIDRDATVGQLKEQIANAADGKPALAAQEPN